MTTFVLVIGGRSHRLPAGARVLTLPQLGLALVKVGSEVRAVSAAGVDHRWSDAECAKLWDEWL